MTPGGPEWAGPSAASDVLALLEEENVALQVHALQLLDKHVHELWYQVSGYISTIEALSEDESFSHRELAALVASKVFYYLGDLDDALSCALSAGTAFDVSGSSDYSQTLLARCVDAYTSSRQQPGSPPPDARIPPLVERLFARCLSQGQADQALGLAIECRRLDQAHAALRAAGSDLPGLVLRALPLASAPTLPAAFSAALVRALAEAYRGSPEPDWALVSEALLELRDAQGLCAVLLALLQSGDERTELAAYAIAYEVADAEVPSLAEAVARELDASAPREVDKKDDEEGEAMETGAEQASEASPLLGDERAATPAPAAAPAPARGYPAHPAARCAFILRGLATVELERRFLSRRCAADGNVLRAIRASVESRNSVCHSATVWANALMHAGTSADGFLRSNLDWLARATNWAKFGATAGLGVIHRGAAAGPEAQRLLGPYLPSAPGAGSSSPYSEGGALFALGLVHARAQGAQAKHALLEALRTGAAAEPVQHGACLGLGVALLGSRDAEALEAAKAVLYNDSAVAGQAAGLALGLLCAGGEGTGAERAGAGDGGEGPASDPASPPAPATTSPLLASLTEEMLAYAADTQHEKIVRGLGLGVALAHVGLGAAGDEPAQRMLAHQDAALRYGGALALGLAHAGTADPGALSALLRVGVSDVSDDVRRSAVSSLGFVLLGRPELAPQTVGLLAQSYNPHVRCGAALALGVACAGTGLPSAAALLEPLLQDASDAVQQGALLALALVLQQHAGAAAQKLRDRVDAVYGNRGAELLARQGAVMAAGILDAGGRNACVAAVRSGGGWGGSGGVENNAGFAPQKVRLRTSAVVGLALFVQHWFWHPLAYCLALALKPAALLGVDARMRAPAAFAARCDARPSRFAYPPAAPAEGARARERAPAAVLSVTSRAAARAGKRAAARRGREADARDARGDERRDDDKKEEEKKEEPLSFDVPNVTRVTPSQRRFVTIPEDQRFRALRPGASSVVVLWDSQPELGPAAYVFEDPAAAVKEETGADAQASGAAPAQAPQEPPPPEPFEYVPS